MSYNGISVPKEGAKITLCQREAGCSRQSHHSVHRGRWYRAGYLEGLGPSVRRCRQEGLCGRRSIHWYEVFAGEKAYKKFGEWLPDDTLAAIKAFRVAIKGPLTTPVGGGIRSLNVTLRQVLNLFACVRPVKYYQGVPSPVKNPGKDEYGHLP